jgi:hypothetical protein
MTAGQNASCHFLKIGWAALRYCMDRPIRVCFWATALQANVFSLAQHLSASPQFKVVVAALNVKQYLLEPINRLYPLQCQILDRSDRNTLKYLRRFQADVTVVDNHYPPEPLSPLLANVWHGFGWRGPEDKSQFKEIYRSIKRLTGLPPDRPNPALMWICAGNTNRGHRIRVTGFHPDNVLAVGQPYTDDIVHPKISKEAAIAYYPSQFANRKICLFAPTWHFGRIFSHWGDDIAIIEKMTARIEAAGGALIIRLHDRKRFGKAYAEQIEALSSRWAHLLVKFKDEQQDHLLDITAADCMVSNYSSMLTFFYGTGKPAIHLYPFRRGEEAPVYRVWKRGRVREMRTPDPGGIWSLSPMETGGPVVYSAPEAFEQMEAALADASIGRAAALQFIAKHCEPYDGNRCKSLADLIQQRVKRLQGGAAVF